MIYFYITIAIIGALLICWQYLSTIEAYRNGTIKKLLESMNTWKRIMFFLPLGCYILFMIYWIKNE